MAASHFHPFEWMCAGYLRFVPDRPKMFAVEQGTKNPSGWLERTLAGLDGIARRRRRASRPGHLSTGIQGEGCSVVLSPPQGIHHSSPTMDVRRQAGRCRPDRMGQRYIVLCGSEDANRAGYDSRRSRGRPPQAQYLAPPGRAIHEATAPTRAPHRSIRCCQRVPGARPAQRIPSLPERIWLGRASRTRLIMGLSPCCPGLSV